MFSSPKGNTNTCGTLKGSVKTLHPLLPTLSRHTLYEARLLPSPAPRPVWQHMGARTRMHTHMHTQAHKHTRTCTCIPLLLGCGVEPDRHRRSSNSGVEVIHLQSAQDPPGQSAPHGSWEQSGHQPAPLCQFRLVSSGRSSSLAEGPRSPERPPGPMKRQASSCHGQRGK